MRKRNRQLSESLMVGALLALAGGYLDVYTYVSRGGVFANAQTGNIVFLGINIANQNWDKVAFYCYPVLAFMLGIFVTELIKKKTIHNPRIHWRQIMIAIEFMLLWIISFVPSGEFDDIVNIAVAFVCSMQVESFRKIHGNAYTTTMCTGNLRSGTEQLFLFCTGKEQAAVRKSLQYYGVIFCFIIGVIFGMKMTQSFQEKSALVVCVLLLIVFVIMFIPEKRETE